MIKYPQEKLSIKKMKGGVCAIKDEFYHPHEYNSTKEYKSFSAEMYIKSKEVGNTGKEYTPSAMEITTASAPQKRATDKNENITSKILNSLKMAATTSTVAAVAIAGVTMLPNDPNVDLLNFSVGQNYVEYELSIEDMQDDLQYYIVISTSNEATKSILVEEDGTYKNKTDGLKSQWEYTLSFISYDDTWGTTTYFEKVFQTTNSVEAPPIPDEESTSTYEDSSILDEETSSPEEEEPPAPDPIPDYQAGITSVEVVGLNQVRIDFWSENLDQDSTLGLWLNADNQSEAILLTQKDLDRGYITTVVEENSTALSIQPIVQYGANEDTIEFPSYDYTLSHTLEADIKVDTVRECVGFYLKGITRGATYVTVMDTATSTELTKQELYEDYVEISYEGEAQFEYTLFLSNDTEEKTTEDFYTSVNTTRQEVGEYTFHYKNTGDVGVTYNEDGTINVYIQTDFTTEDERLYYQIQLGSMRFQSREPLFTAFNLPNQYYGLIYEICYDDNDVQYCINSTSVSGTVNEFGFDGLINTEFTETTALLTIYDYKASTIDFDSILVVTSNGEEIQLSADSFAYIEDEGIYTANCTFENDFEFITIYLTCAPFAHNMDGIDEYIGSTFIAGNTVIYKDIEI